MSSVNTPNWNSGAINNTGLQTQLKNYIAVRERFNDKSLPAFVELMTGVFTALNTLQAQVNSGSVIVNNHTHQTVPPAHTLTP
jgi:hypothetical protein